MDFALSSVNNMIMKAASEFCQREVLPLADQIAEKCDFPDELLDKFAKARLLGITVPKEYGGVSSTNLNLVIVAEELGKTGTACFWPFAMNNSVAETIFKWGTEDIKKQFIPKLCDGTAYGGVAFTEIATGSDPRMITTTASLDDQKYVVNGTKRFITLGNKPGYSVIYAKDKSLGNTKDDITALIVDKSAEGYSTSKPWKLMGLEGINLVDVFLNDVNVPKKHILGERGKGFGILLKWIASERIQQAAFMTGIGQAAIDESVGYVKSRNVAGKPMSYMQGTQWMLAEMNVNVDACRLLTRKAAFMQDENQSIDSVSSGLKIFVVPTIQEVARKALQLHGSYGYTREYKVERLYRNAAHAGVVASSTEINKTIAGISLLR